MWLVFPNKEVGSSARVLWMYRYSLYLAQVGFMIYCSRIKVILSQVNFGHSIELVRCSTDGDVTVECGVSYFSNVAKV